MEPFLCTWLVLPGALDAGQVASAPGIHGVEGNRLYLDCELLSGDLLISLISSPLS